MTRLPVASRSHERKLACSTPRQPQIFCRHCKQQQCTNFLHLKSQLLKCGYLLTPAFMPAPLAGALPPFLCKHPVGSRCLLFCQGSASLHPLFTHHVNRVLLPLAPSANCLATASSLPSREQPAPGGGAAAGSQSGCSLWRHPTKWPLGISPVALPIAMSLLTLGSSMLQVQSWPEIKQRCFLSLAAAQR